MGFTYSNKLFGGTGSGGVSVSGGVNTQVAYFTGASSISSDSGLTYNASTGVLANSTRITTKALTVSGLATPGSITVTPTLSQVATITTVAGASLVDGDYFTIDYGSGTIPIEFDLSPGNGTTGGRIPLLFTAGDSADLIRDNIILLLNAAAPTQITASSGGAATVNIVMDTPGVAGGTNTENVAAAGFAVTGFANPTAATTYTYRLVARLADGTTTEAGADSTTAAGHATLSAANYNALSWAAVTGAASYDVYRTVGGATQGKIAAATALSLNDTGLAGGGETAPTTNGTGVVRANAVVIGGDSGIWRGSAKNLYVGSGAANDYSGALWVYDIKGLLGIANAGSSQFYLSTVGGTSYLTIPAAAILQLGAAASATPVAQTLQAQGATGTNISGADFTVSAGKGTGLANSTAAGRRGDLKLRTQVRGSTGSTADTVGTDRAVFAGQVVTLTESSATPVLDYAVASGSVAGGTLYYTIRADDATDFQVVRGSIPFTAVNKGGVLTATVGTAAESVAVSAGTLTNTVTITTGTNSITLNLNAVSSLTQTTLYAYVSALIDGTGVATTK